MSERCILCGRTIPCCHLNEEQAAICYPCRESPDLTDLWLCHLKKGGCLLSFDPEQADVDTSDVESVQVVKVPKSTFAGLADLSNTDAYLLVCETLPTIIAQAIEERIRQLSEEEDPRYFRETLGQLLRGREPMSPDELDRRLRQCTESTVFKTRNGKLVAVEYHFQDGKTLNDWNVSQNPEPTCDQERWQASTTANNIAFGAKLVTFGKDPVEAMRNHGLDEALIGRVQQVFAAQENLFDSTSRIWLAQLGFANPRVNRLHVEGGF